MNTTALLRVAQACAIASILGGCAYGQKYSYQGSPVPMARIAANGTVALAVHDKRPYVVSHNKPESFVGLSRGGFGNPFDVNTVSGQPMAIDMRDSIAGSMRAKGIEVKSITIDPSDSADKALRALVGTGARKLVLVTLTEWKSDIMISAALVYDASVVVMNEKGDELARARTNGRDNLGPSPNSSVGLAFSRKFEVLFDDEKIVQALK